MQASKRPGLTKVGHGESKRSGFTPTGTLVPPPVITCTTKERPCLARWMHRPWVYGRMAEPNGTLYSNGLPRPMLPDYRPQGCNGQPALPRCQPGTAECGMGVTGNRRLTFTAESSTMNAGDADPDAKASSPPMLGQRVRAAIVVGGRESRPQGEGRQAVVLPEHR